MNTSESRSSWCGLACSVAAALLGSGCSKSENAAAPSPVSAECPDAGAMGGSNGGTGTDNGVARPTENPAAGSVLFAFDEATDVAAVQPSTAGQNGNLNAQATLSWDGGQGDPDNGSLVIAAPFSAYNQLIDFQFPLALPSDLTGKVVYVRIKLDEGFNPDRSAPGGLIFYIQTGDDFAWGQAEWTNIEQPTQGKWREYAFEMSFPWREVTAAGVQGSALSFDPARVRQIGILIHTGGGGGSPLLPVPAVFHIDSIGYWDPELIE